MPDLDKNAISSRLSALYADLAASPPEEECSPQIARVFNALLAETRQHLETDPVIKSVGALRPTPDDGNLPSLRTVQTLVGQLNAALTQQQSSRR